MGNECFNINQDSITYKINNLTSMDFFEEDGYMCFNHQFKDKGIEINYRISINKKHLEKKSSLSSPKKIFTITKATNKRLNIFFTVKAGKYHLNAEGKRFCFYTDSDDNYAFSFKMTETKKGAFDYKTKADLKSKKNNKKLTSKDVRQKWIIEHPFQGGSFTPK